MEEKKKILEQIRQKINELREVIVEEEDCCVRLIDNSYIFFRESYDLENLKKTLEEISNLNVYKVLINAIEQLKEEINELEEENSNLSKENEMLKNIIRKLTSEEELKERLEELEEEESGELTKEEIKYLLGSVFDC